VQTAQQAFMKVLDKLLEGKKDGAAPGGSPGGGPSGSPGGGKDPAAGQGSLGSVASTPAAGPGGAEIAKGEKAVPAVKAAKTAKDSVRSAKESYDKSSVNVAKLLEPFKAGTNGPKVDAAVGKVKSAEGTTLTAAGLAPALQVADSKVKDFKEKIEAEAKRMEAEAKLAGDAATALGGHKTEGTGDDEKYTDPKTKVESRSGNAPAGQKPPAEYDPANAVKAAEAVIARAEENKKKVSTAQEGLKALDGLPEMPATAKPTLASIGKELATMNSSAEEAIRSAKGYIENLKAVQQYTRTASQELTNLMPTNDQAQKDVTSSLEQAARTSGAWSGSVKQKPGPKESQEGDVAALTKAQAAAQKGKTAAEKIKTGAIE
jgi:hypothetical protein